MTTLTAKQMADQFARAARDVDERVGKVVQAAAYAIRRDAYETLADESDAHAYAGRSIQADPVGPMTMQVGYANDIEGLAAAVEYGSATVAPTKALGSAANREAPELQRIAPLAALKALR